METHKQKKHGMNKLSKRIFLRGYNPFMMLKNEKSRLKNEYGKDLISYTQQKSFQKYFCANITESPVVPVFEHDKE